MTGLTSRASSVEMASHLVKPFWLVAWAHLVAVGWLLPNHYPPWSTFHMDAWIAVAFLLIAARVSFRPSGSLACYGLSALVGVIVLVPWLQYGIGLVTSPGIAWINTAYLVGFLLALLVGSRWEAASPGQLMDGLFLAIGIAAVLSVGLQLNQWLLLDLLDLSSMGNGAGRPFANFGQPNQLSTFLLWGVLAATWGLVRRKIRLPTALLMVMFLLFGIALTQSRTAWITITLMICASWVWRRHWSHRHWPWIATAMGMYFWGCVLCISWFNRVPALNLPLEIEGLARFSGELRPVVWRMFAEAAMLKPWLGYGWGQIALAQLSITTEYPTLHVFFSHSHNLFLDLVLWCGIPIGLTVSAGLLWWLWQKLRTVSSAENVVLLLFVIAVSVHSMLELPLHHAYFLIPAGMVMGAMDARAEYRPIAFVNRQAIKILWLAAALLLALIVRDYTRVEPTFQNLRFEWARIQNTPPTVPPDVLLLTQWSDFVSFATLEPKEGTQQAELQWMRNVAGLSPSAGLVQKLAIALALNGRPQEAAEWLGKMCGMVPAAQCELVKQAWVQQAVGKPHLIAVPWPGRHE